MFTMARGAVLWLSLAGTLAAASAALADHDIYRLVVGRVTYPAGGWVLDADSDYSLARLSDGSADEFQFTGELEWGATDRLSVGVGLSTTQARRDLVAPGRAILEARYRVLDRPFQLASIAEFKPSLQGESSEWEVGAEVLKNARAYSLLLIYAGELEEEGGARRFASHLAAGPFFRFGLQGGAGLLLRLKPERVRILSALLGGAVSKNVFVALEPRFALSDAAPDFGIGIQVHFYRGTYGVGSWLFE
jgi:hypothetical protein